MWLVAIGAGGLETFLVVANVLWGDGSVANGEGLNARVAVRLIIFVAMTLVALQMLVSMLPQPPLCAVGQCI